MSTRSTIGRCSLVRLWPATTARRIARAASQDGRPAGVRPRSSAGRRLPRIRRFWPYGHSSATLGPVSALAAGEEVPDLPDDPCPVAGTVDRGGVHKRAFGRLERSMRLVGGEEVL